MFIYDLTIKKKASIMSLGIGCSQDESLCLMAMSVNDAVAVTLAFSLYCNSTLKELYLSNNLITDAGVVALAQALHHNSTLDLLYLSDNNQNVSDAGAVVLAEALHHKSTLKVYLYGNDAIGKESTHQLVPALTIKTN